MTCIKKGFEEFLTGKLKSCNWPLVSVIVVNYNGKDLLERCLKSLLNSNYSNFEVIFVDNGSFDGSVDLIQRLFSSNTCLKIICNKENLGFAEGNNIGARQAKGKYVVFLNTDTEVDPAWLRELVKVLESDPTIGAAQSKILRMDNRKIFDSTGDIMDYYGSTFSMGRGEKDMGQYSNVEEIFSARGAAIIVRRGVFEDVGMFDQKFFLVLEDVDLCWRIRLSGYRIVYVPKSIVYHLGGATLKECPKSFKIITDVGRRRNQIMMMVKNYETRNAIKYVPLPLLLNIIGILSTLITNLPDAKNIFKGFKDSLDLRYAWTERLHVQHNVRKVSDAFVIPHMLKSNPTHLLRYILDIHIYGERYAAQAYLLRNRRRKT